VLEIAAALLSLGIEALFESAVLVKLGQTTLNEYETGRIEACGSRTTSWRRTESMMLGSADPVPLLIARARRQADHRRRGTYA
jgi:hypothetical protein